MKNLAMISRGNPSKWKGKSENKYFNYNIYGHFIQDYKMLYKKTKSEES